jgi:Putative Ig domain
MSRGRGAAIRVTTLLAAASVIGLGLGIPALAAPAQAAPAQTAPAQVAAASGYRHGVVPTVSTARAPASAAGQAVATSNLVYGGGVADVGVTTGAPKVYVVFWGSQWGSSSVNGQGNVSLSGDSKGMAPVLQAFLKGLGTASESWSGVMTQYCEGVAVGAQTCPAVSAHVGYPSGGALAGVWADTAAASPASATAHQLAFEAVMAANHFGNTTQASNRNAQYFIVSPSGTTPDGFNPVKGNFCAWHDFSGDPTLPGGGAVTSPIAVAFTNLPYLTDAGSGCGMNFVNGGSAGALDGVTIVGGHEYAETITDQFPAGGWLDNTAQQNENGDKCAWIATGQGASQNIVLATGTFAVQSTWANDFNGGTGGCLVSHAIIANLAPTITSANHVTFAAGTHGAFTITTIGSPVPAISESGVLPPGVVLTDNHDGSATLAGTPAATAGGTYPLTLAAASGVGSTATQSFILSVDQGPVITSGANAGFVVGVASSFTVIATGVPAPTVAVTGVLPAGITFNAATATFAGTAAQNAKGSYPLTVTATNNTAATATQNLTVTVNQATLTYPADGQTNIDTTQPFTWSALPQAQGYYLIVGTTLYGADLINSGVLPATQTTLNGPALPTNTTLHATLYTAINGTWASYQTTTFTAAAGQGTLTYPTNNQTNVDPTHPFTWTPITHTQGYYLTVGTTPYASNLVNSGIIAATQTTYPTPFLPANQTLYATLYTAVNGTWRPQSITLTTGPTAATFTAPQPGQTVTTPTTITWNPITQAQGYFLTIGTTPYGSDVTTSGVLPATQTTLTLTTLPKNKTLYATLFTATHGAWTGIQTTTFTAG